MSLFGNVFAVVMVVAACASARAELKEVSHWRLGEDDAGAKAGGVVTETTDAGPGKRTLKASGAPAYGDQVGDKAPASKLAIKFDGKADVLQRTGLTELKDNFVAEVFARATTSEGFHYIIQYGSTAHGWSIVRNSKGYQLLIGGIALVGWSGDVPENEWVHLAVARVDGVTRFYFNGKPAGDSGAALNDAGAGAVFTIGGTNEKKELFAGDIDDVKISTFPAGGFNPDMLMVNDPDGTNAKKSAAKTAPAPIGAGDASASIIFDADPAMKNMTFQRTSVVPRTVKGSNGEKQAWVAENGSAQDVPWARSILITLTDPALREGRSPVVDIEVEYRQAFDSPVELRADTATGSRKVGGGWGRNEGWQTFTVRVDDAFFGARSHGHKPSDMDTDGYDLRLNSFGTDFAVRSIKVRAYNLNDRPNYKRLVRFDGLATAGDLLLFAPGATANIDYQMTNLATAPVKLTYRHDVVDRAGKIRDTVSGDVTAPPQAQQAISVPVNTAGYERGVYETRLKVLSPDDKVVVERRGGFGVADETPVARAKPGEFLYGLDVKLGPAYDSPRLLRWAKFMGADIIRHGFGWSDGIDEISDHLPTYDTNGQQVMLMCDPPKTQDQGERAQQLAKKVQYLETVARQFPQIKYFELGNEPDLTFFYPGPIDHYVEDFQVMSDAIRRGNPDAVVLNGGLCFAGADAVKRATRFIELVDPSQIGAWSYHGHGPGWGAESSALNRIRDLVRAQDKLKPFADTESGVAAQTPAQEQVQARTVVQKMVYAQQQKLPFLIFFRLLMFEEAYGMLYSEQEPRPSVLSYATLVRELRGQAYQSDLTDLPTGVHGFLFAKSDGADCAAVLWSDGSGVSQVQLSLSGAAACEAVDLYGNRTNLKLQPDGSFALDVGADPLYLKWTGEPTSALAVVPSSIGIPSEIAVRASGDDVIPVTVTSYANQPVVGTLRITAGTGAGVTLPEQTVPVKVEAGQSTVLRLPVQVLKQTGVSIDWPRQWTVFVSPDLKQADPKSLTGVPDALPKIGGGTVKGRQVVLQSDRIDFESLGGKMREKETALVMAVVHSDTDQEVTVGASADWWMEWTVNGKVVYSTIDRGNGGGYSINDHTFAVSLKQGDNVVAVRALSGSMGWKLLIGSPARLAEQKADPALNGLRLELEQPGRATQSKVVAIRRVSPIETWTIANDGLKLADWNKIQPDLVLLENVVNAFAKMPDATKWWHGSGDLSARGWVRATNEQLIVSLAVTDDQHHPAATDAEQGDALRLSWTTQGGKVVALDVIPSSSGKVVCTFNKGATSEQAQATFTREGDTSFYQIRVSAGSDKPAYLNVTLFDQDDVPAKQQMTLAPVSPVPLEGWLRLVWAE